MKRAILLILLFGLFLLILPAKAEEKIDDFSVKIKINSDASIDVTEQIAYNFGEAKRHGIYRDILYKYSARGGNYKLRFTGFAVRDESGNEYQFRQTEKGDNINIRIGNPDSYVSGVKTYVISYTVTRALNYFDAHDELYWNITGNDWPVTIEQARATIILPQETLEQEVKKECFVGSFGQDNECVSFRYEYNDQGEVKNIVFANDRLEGGEGMTIAVGWPKGMVTQPSALAMVLETVKDNAILLLPIFVLILFIYLWRAKGRDPRGRGTIIAQFGPPDNLTPAEVGTIIDENVENHEISAEIVNLAVRGYLRIRKIKGKGLLKSDDYELIKLKDGASLQNEFERKLFTSIFSEDKTSIKLSGLKNKFYKDLAEIKKLLYSQAVDKKYFPKSPRKTRITYLIIGAVIIFSGWFLGPIFGWLGVLSVWMSGIIVIIFSFFMGVKTRAGVLAREHILGLKEYLRVAEKDRIKFHNAPAKNPEQFEKLLPYAMVLGVEKEWAKQFAGICNQSPSWYSDAGSGNFTALALTNSLGRFESKANSTITSRPSSSASSGGSGFSSGFSGSGFGGGGGGSW